MGSAVPHRHRAAIAGALILLTSAGVAWGAPTVRIVQETGVRLSIHPITADTVDGKRPPFLLEIPPGAETGRLDLELRWPDPDSVATLHLSATRKAGSTEFVDLAATVSRGGSGRTARRSLRLEDSPTTLLEVDRKGERTLTLAIESSLVSRTVVSEGAPTVGRPVSLKLEIQAIRGSESESLETNRLNTFVGEPVTYSFRSGAENRTESVTVTLRPVRLIDEIVEIEILVNGMLPGAEGSQLLNRRENWVTSRGITSTLAFQSGAPPRGYRFLVTPTF